MYVASLFFDTVHLRHERDKFGGLNLQHVSIQLEEISFGDGIAQQVNVHAVDKTRLHITFYSVHTQKSLQSADHSGKSFGYGLISGPAVL